MHLPGWHGSQRPLLVAGLFLGVGMGGFFDGILFHQLMQVHNMLSHRFFPDTLRNAEINMFWDGVFHTFCYAMAATGIAHLFRVAKQGGAAWSSASFVGALCFGAGSFNLIEGLIDHQVLQVHHVLERAAPMPQLLADLAFLLSGILLIGAGGRLCRRGAKETETSAKLPG